MDPQKPTFTNSLAQSIHAAGVEIELSELTPDGTAGLRALPVEQRNADFLKSLATAIENGEASADQRAAALAFFGEGNEVLTRGTFEQLSHEKRTDFFKRGGKIVDDGFFPKKATPRPALSEKQIYRSDFDRLTHADRAARMREGFRLVDG